MHTIVILDPMGAPLAHVHGRVKIINPLYKIQPYHPKSASVTFPSAAAGKEGFVAKEESMMGDLSEDVSVF